jgi:hypothetical protein
MADYRLYVLDSSGHITRREDFQFPDDDQAIAHAIQFVNGKALELWSGTRVVTRIEPNSAEMSAGVTPPPHDSANSP